MMTGLRQSRLDGRSVLVTGGSGEVGSRLVPLLLEQGASVKVLTRSATNAARTLSSTKIRFFDGDLAGDCPLGLALEGVDTIFHLASHSARLHGGRVYEDPRHWQVTVEGTTRLLEAAIGAECRQLIFFSSIKAGFEETGSTQKPIDESVAARPETLYGRAKYAAEEAIAEATRRSTLKATVLRFPMVYGLDSVGNLARMLDGVARGQFPPFPRLENRRSAIHVSDAIRAAILSATQPADSFRLYYVCDGQAYSTRWIYEQICESLGRQVPRIAPPRLVWQIAAKAGDLIERTGLGRPPLNDEAYHKLFGNAWISSQRISKELGFTPTRSLADEIPVMASRYLERSPSTSRSR